MINPQHNLLKKTHHKQIKRTSRSGSFGKEKKVKSGHLFLEFEHLIALHQVQCVFFSWRSIFAARTQTKCMVHVYQTIRRYVSHECLPHWNCCQGLGSDNGSCARCQVWLFSVCGKTPIICPWTLLTTVCLCVRVGLGLEPTHSRAHTHTRAYVLPACPHHLWPSLGHTPPHTAMRSAF